MIFIISLHEDKFDDLIFVRSLETLETLRWKNKLVNIYGDSKWMSIIAQHRVRIIAEFLRFPNGICKSKKIDGKWHLRSIFLDLQVRIRGFDTLFICKSRHLVFVNVNASCMSRRSYIILDTQFINTRSRRRQAWLQNCNLKIQITQKFNTKL